MQVISAHELITYDCFILLIIYNLYNQCFFFPGIYRIFLVSNEIVRDHTNLSLRGNTYNIKYVKFNLNYKINHFH
jgi:hypothetical protein